VGEPNGIGPIGTGPNGSGALWNESDGNGLAGPAAVAAAAPVLAPVPLAAPLATTAPSGLIDPHDLSDADRAAAASAAADWAAGQLALAGVPSKSGNGTSGSAPAMTTPARGAYPARVVRRVIRVLMALMVALVLLAVLTVLGVTLGSGSSLRGGAGDNTYAPANVSAVQSHYRLGAGNLDLNLAAVKFPSAGKTVDVTVGLGKLTVEVPKNTVINLQARSGLGQVDVFGRTASNVQETYYIGTPTSTAPRLNLNAHVGIGSIQISQG
jgi:Cell wall-active antibiotics response 4TMS YvqF